MFHNPRKIESLIKRGENLQEAKRILEDLVEMQLIAFRPIPETVTA